MREKLALALMTTDSFLLKDFFNRETIGIIDEAISAVHPAFDSGTFLAAVFDDRWNERELKQRMRHTSTCLRAGLPTEYEAALQILVRASPATAEAGFAAMVLSDFVEAHGVEHFEPSVAALSEFTRVVSAEFAVRPFLVRYPDDMLARMRQWAEDDDPALRRLASEGSRPRLPWGMALKQFKEDPSPILPILETLRHDPSEDVRRSVANNLNDIAKDHPDLVVEVLTRWQDGTAEVADITRHALRVLIKEGHPGALRLLGFSPEPEVVVEDLDVSPEYVSIGDKVVVSFSVRSTGASTQPVVIDGVVHYARPRKRARKVFKWKTAELEAGARLDVKRSVTLQHLSTRRIHPGRHTVAVQVNGSRLAEADFEVTA